MSEFEEETYSTIFAALKHPTRRKILRLLSEQPRSFTEIQNLFKVDSPYLTYHLDALKELVSKTEDGRYRLSTMGEGAMALIRGVEEAPKKPTFALPFNWKTKFLRVFQGQTFRKKILPAVLILITCGVALSILILPIVAPTYVTGMVEHQKIGYGKNSKGERIHWYTVTVEDHQAYIVSEEDWYRVNPGDYVNARLLKDGISIKIVEVKRIPTNLEITVKFENGTICPQAIITLISTNWLTEKNTSYAAFTLTGEHVFKSIIPDEYFIYVYSYNGQYNGRSWVEILPWEDIGKTIEKTVIIE